MTKIAVIIGSTREGRMTDRLSKWVQLNAAKVATAEIVDLKDYPLPFFDELISPRYNPDRKPTPEVQKWLDKISEFDGFVIVTPEYNRSITGALKNAIDTLGNEVVDKPVAIVAHGTSGGAQAVASLRITLPGVGAVALPQALFFTDRVGEAISEEGMLAAELQENPYGHQANLDAQLHTLVRYAEALKG